MKWLQGKKTIIGMIAAGLLTTMYGLDLLVNDNPATAALELGWLSHGQYAAIAGPITAWTGIAIRLAVKKATP